MLASDRDRERTSEALREHFVRGRLSVEELARRVELVLAARSRADLRVAVAGLPLAPDVHELVEHGRAFAAAAARGFTLAALTVIYMLFTLVLAIAVPVMLLVHGATGSALLALLVVWLVPTVLLSRLWRRGIRRRSR